MCVLPHPFCNPLYHQISDASFKKLIKNKIINLQTKKINGNIQQDLTNF